VTAPAASWDGDPLWITEQAADILRLSPSDPDMPRLGRLSLVSIELVKRHLQWLVPFDDPTMAPIPEPITDACVNATVEFYRRKDAPFGITGAWSADGLSMHISRDWLNSVLYSLQPYREAWGIA
jgi:hypothetical protein